ncbi:MAG: hypothetical protein MUO67_25885 [Anaerolineales bacterium]|nr:hypothetical protein [Anaerolineales bacterium]
MRIIDSVHSDQGELSIRLLRIGDAVALEYGVYIIGGLEVHCKSTLFKSQQVRDILQTSEVSKTSEVY